MIAQEYGLFEARIKLPAGHGLWPAFWMEGADIDQVHWPASGEIDIIEVNNAKLDLVESYLHTPEESYGAYYLLPDSLSWGHHVYAIDWNSSGISWMVDGHTYGHVSAYFGWPFSQPFFLILDLAVGGTRPGSPTLAPSSRPRWTSPGSVSTGRRQYRRYLNPNCRLPSWLILNDIVDEEADKRDDEGHFTGAGP